MSAAPFPPLAVRTRLHTLPAGIGHPFRWAVVLAAPPLEPDPADLLRSAEMAALLTHNPDVSWPDAAGQVLAAETLKRGGVAALAFACLADALTRKARICGGAA